MKKSRMMLLAGAGVLVALPGLTQQITVQPKGQSPEQMNADMAACANSAQQATGYNPAQAAAPTQRQVGGRVKGAAAGAAGGAAAGQARSNQYEKVPSGAQEQYRQDQAKSGAAAGAAVGASKQRQDRREARRETNANDEKASAYNQTYKSCLQARGYIVG